MSSEAWVTARDGSRRLVRAWPASDPHAFLLLVHGLSEHSGRYEAVGTRLAAAGIDVTAFDQYGCGASDGSRSDIDTWTHFHDDVEDRLAAVRVAAAGRPVVLYGHSLGGLVALGYVLDDRPAPDLLVLSSPGLAVEVPLRRRGVVAALGRLAPGLRLPNGIDAGALAADPAVSREYLDDPLCVHRSALRWRTRGSVNSDGYASDSISWVFRRTSSTGARTVWSQPSPASRWPPCRASSGSSCPASGMRRTTRRTAPRSSTRSRRGSAGRLSGRPFLPIRTSSWPDSQA